MNKLLTLGILFLFTFNLCLAQSNQTNSKNSDEILKPALVIGILVDQMRYDYLTRYYHRYGEGGFKRLMNDGFEFKNNHFNYIPTYTGPGHASVFTGTYPAIHGVIANDWYDKELKRFCSNDCIVYCLCALPQHRNSESTKALKFYQLAVSIIEASSFSEASFSDNDNDNMLYFKIYM